jgi:hypothetical protein
MFTATGLLQGDMIGFPDICIFVSDAPKKWTHLHSHSWGKRKFFGQYEGSNSRAACEGFATIFNTMPNTHLNTKLVSPVQQTTAGVRRYKDPGAGSITHHYGVHSEAMDVISAGMSAVVVLRIRFIGCESCLDTNHLTCYFFLVRACVCVSFSPIKRLGIDDQLR